MKYIIINTKSRETLSKKGKAVLFDTYKEAALLVKDFPPHVQYEYYVIAIKLD